MTTNMRDSTIKVKINLPNYSKPLIMVKNIETRPNTYIASSLNSWTYIFRISDDNSQILATLQLDSPVSAFYLNERNNVLYLGTIAGHVFLVDCTTYSLMQARYLETNRFHSEIVCLYERAGQLFIWDINSQVKIVNTLTLQKMETLSLGLEITCAIYVQNPWQQSQIMCCAAFHNGLLPVLFNCSSPNNLKQTLRILTEFNKDEDSQQGCQITEMAFRAQSNRLSIVCGALCSREKGEQGGKSQISIYQVMKIQETQKRREYFWLECQYKFCIDGTVGSLAISEQKLTINSWKSIKIINLETRQQIVNFVNSKNSLGWVFGLKHTGQEHRLLIVRGWNFRNAGKVDKKNVGVHIYKILLCSLYNDYPAHSIMTNNQPGQPRAIFVAALCAIIVLLNHFYRQPLYDRGIEMITSWQSHQLWMLELFFVGVTMLSDPAVIFLGAIAMVVANKFKGHSYILLVFILFNVYLAALLKAFDCDPRPIWTSNVIRNIGFYCPSEYGNPSGHSWFSAVIGFGILLDFKGAGRKFMNIWISVVVAILVPISRMYLGAHSLNQVLQGLTLGLACCLLYTFAVKKSIQQFLLEFNYDYRWKGLITLCHVLYLLPFVVNANEELPEEWVNNILVKCNKHMDESRLNYMMLVANALFVNVATGIGLGYSSLANHKLGRSYLEGKWEINEQKFTPKKGYLYFILVQLACLLSGLACAGIVVKLLPTKTVGFIAISLGALASGYLYTAKTIRVLAHFKLIRTVTEN